MRDVVCMRAVCVRLCGGSCAHHVACRLCTGSTVAVFGLGAVGLAVIEAAHQGGAKRIIAVDLNADKAGVAMKFGATDFVNPKDFTQSIQVAGPRRGIVILKSTLCLLRLGFFWLLVLIVVHVLLLLQLKVLTWTAVIVVAVTGCDCV